jgi:hypothetical protein
MKIGVTGHQKLGSSRLWSWVKDSLRAQLRRLEPPLLGITSLAVGADQLFANAILDLGGELVVVIPFSNYERTFKAAADLKRYEIVVARAKFVETLARQTSDEQSYMAAGIRIVELSDIIFAVWNGKEAQGFGGTGDVVRYAQRKGRRIVHINPENQSMTCI